jgi:chromosomal replication initiator protein
LGLLGFLKGLALNNEGESDMSLMETTTPIEPPPIPTASIRNIQVTVAEYFKIDLIELLSERQDKRVSHPRQIAMWLARKLTFCSIPKIGKSFRRDHSTVHHGVRTIDRKQATDPQLRDQLDHFITILMRDEAA